MEVAQGSLVIMNPHTSVQVFWNGKKVEGVKRVRILSDEDTDKVKIIMAPSELADEMRAAGINVKEI